MVTFTFTFTLQQLVSVAHNRAQYCTFLGLSTPAVPIKLISLYPLYLQTMASNIFDELVCALNPYIDDITTLPTFHRFTDLPLELRFNVYEQYFINDSRSLACSKWPDENGTARIQLRKPNGRRWSKAAPFLPAICFVDHAVNAEAVPFLIGSARCRIEEPYEAAWIFMKAGVSNILSKVRQLELSDTNGLGVHHLLSLGEEEHAKNAGGSTL